jgi:hypothetical protein
VERFRRGARRKSDQRTRRRRSAVLLIGGIRLLAVAGASSVTLASLAVRSWLLLRTRAGHAAVGWAAPEAAAVGSAVAGTVVT